MAKRHEGGVAIITVYDKHGKVKKRVEKHNTLTQLARQAIKAIWSQMIYNNAKSGDLLPFGPSMLANAAADSPVTRNFGQSTSYYWDGVFLYTSLTVNAKGDEVDFGTRIASAQSSSSSVSAGNYVLAESGMTGDGVQITAIFPPGVATGTIGGIALGGTGANYSSPDGNPLTVKDAYPQFKRALETQVVGTAKSGMSASYLLNTQYVKDVTVSSDGKTITVNKIVPPLYESRAINGTTFYVAKCFKNYSCDMTKSPVQVTYPTEVDEVIQNFNDNYQPVDIIKSVIPGYDILVTYYTIYSYERFVIVNNEGIPTSKYSQSDYFFPKLLIEREDDILLFDARISTGYDSLYVYSITKAALQTWAGGGSAPARTLISTINILSANGSIIQARNANVYVKNGNLCVALPNESDLIIPDSFLEGGTYTLQTDYTANAATEPNRIMILPATDTSAPIYIEGWNPITLSSACGAPVQSVVDLSDAPIEVTAEDSVKVTYKITLQGLNLLDVG
jgi:hypothetical protein